jgi:hypothetical protein
MSQSDFDKVFAAISSDLTRGPKDEYFLDGQVGFVAQLVWAESAISLIESRGNHELALQYMSKCRSILDCVNNHGWTVVTKRVAVEHAAVMLNQHWK